MKTEILETFENFIVLKFYENFELLKKNSNLRNV
jgi:hypothetical protein